MNRTEAFKKIAQIIREIKEGKRLHEQRAFHSNEDHNATCGTAHCIAGWFIIDYMENNKIQPKWDKWLYNCTSYIQFDLDNFDEVYDNYISKINNEIEQNEFIEAYNDALYKTTPEWAFVQAIMEITNEESEELFREDLCIDEIEEAFLEMADNYYMEEVREILCSI